MGFEGGDAQQELYEPGMSPGEEIGFHPIMKSIKDTGQCTRSNKANGNFV